MNQQKTTQVLKQIFDIYGVEIVKEQNSFKAAVFDLLDEKEYKDERVVLKYAIESGAIPVLLSSSKITASKVQKAVKEIQEDCHMVAEDAEFVVGCIVAACGVNPAVVTENVREGQETEEQAIQKSEPKTRKQAPKENEPKTDVKVHQKKVQKTKKWKKIGVAVIIGAAVVFLVVAGIVIYDNSIGKNESNSNRNQFQYQIDDGSVRISKYIGNNSKVEIPAKIEGLPVTQIDDKAFKGCLEVTNITMPDSITEIGNFTFWKCENLVSIELSENITEIGIVAFAECSSLTEIDIPDGVTIIKRGTFRECSSLKTVYLPESLTEILEDAFLNCSSLDTICINKSVYVAETAFDKGTEIQYTDEVGPVFAETSENTTSQNEDNGNQFQYYIYDAGSVWITKYIGKDSSVTIPSEIEGLPVTRIDDNAFKDCLEITSITMPNSITEIGDCAFWGCKNLTDIILSENITEIGEMAFVGCSSLTEIDIPDGVTIIKGGTFGDCSSLETVYLPKGLTEIWGEAFGTCSSLSRILIPSTITYIAKSAFNEETEIIYLEN